MSFFQNPFRSEFRGNLVLGDRSQALEFVCPGNTGRGDDMTISWKGLSTYDLSGNDSDSNATKTLNIRYSLDAQNFTSWALLSVDISAGAGSTSAVKPAEIVAALNASSAFTNLFTAQIISFNGNLPPTNDNLRIQIQSIKPVTRFHFYVQSGQADSVLNFNARAGVSELPAYFNRHTIANALVYPDSVGMLIILVPGSSNVDQATIDNAVDKKGNSLGYSHSTVQTDYALLAGRSGLFQFTKNVVDTSNRITSQIIYSAGAKVGDLAMKTTYSYTTTNTLPTTSAQVPYTLASGDLITPP